MRRLGAGSLLWVSLPSPELSDADRAFLERVDPAGVVIFRENVRNPGQVRDLNARIRNSCPSGEVLIAVDQEGGRVARLREGVPLLPPMRTLGATNSLETVREAGAGLGRALRDLGFDVDFAPVLDVDSNPENPIIGDRSFSSDPEWAGRCAMAFADGLSSAGILPCGKHFPGHGETDLDSHLALPSVLADERLLNERELVPFRRAIESAIPLMMTAHVVYPAWDRERPATLSPAIVTGLLKERLGYRGLVLSDDLLMKAVSGNGVVRAAFGALDAGCDGLLVLKDQGQALEVLEALERESLARPERLAPALERFREWRQKIKIDRTKHGPVPDRGEGR